MLDLVLFEHRDELVDVAVAAGIGTFIVDWEWRGKEERQRHADTEIDPGTAEDLAAIAKRPGIRAWCRVNPLGPWSRQEVEVAVSRGAQCILLPMARTVSEVERFLELVDGRCRAGILVETVDAVACAPELAGLPLAAVYVGLNDLAIERKDRFLFEAVLDGTVERLRQVFTACAFGFGGVTVLDGGDPIPCRLLLQEMARLDCAFSLLRRSFKRDIRGRDMAAELRRIAGYWDRLRRRGEDERARDHASLCAAIRQQMNMLQANA